MTAVAHDEGIGSFAHPVPRGMGGLAGDYYVQVGIFERPSSSFEMAMPGEDEEYASVYVAVACGGDRSTNCAIHAHNFALAGDMGIVYENALDLGAIEIAPGEVIDTVVKALVKKDDRNLLLLFSHFEATPFTYPVVLEAAVNEGMTESLEVVALIGMVARVGPVDNLAFTGVFGKGEALTALGRSEGGDWLRIAFGWVPAVNVEAAGDIMSLPVTTK
ncbi:MAG: hypothetical protein OXG78_14100 [Chloroflexi bacterium]|nr:hypothetical protein [Chloroflexota bacterium]